MIDLVDRVAAYLTGKGYQDVTTRMLDSTTGREAIVVRRLPYTVNAHYQDRTATLGYLYQVIVRNRDEAHAMNICSEIAEDLENARIESGNGSYVFTSAEIYTSPQQLPLEEQLFYAWEVRINALIET
jgi:hypothetical protein